MRRTMGKEMKSTAWTETKEGDTKSKGTKSEKIKKNR